MKYILLLLTLTLSTAQASLGTFDKQGRFIYPATNKPYTGNLDVINNNWGKDAVEFNKDYVDGILHGSEKVYYQSGKLKSLGHFNQGKVDGMVELYYEDDSIQARVGFNNGTREGRAVSYYPDGTKQSEQFYVDDKLDGLSREWFESGVLMISRDYSNGLLHGEVKTYYESGKVFEEIRYEYGTPKLMIIYNEDGAIADKKGWLDKRIIERVVG